MKLLFIALSTLLLAGFTDSTLYAISFERITGQAINLSAYKNKKIVIAVFNASNPDTNRLRYLDSLQASSPSLQVIGVPTDNFGGSFELQRLKKVQADFHILVAAPLHVKKGGASGQHALFAWLTSAVLNGHFGEDVKSAGQLYIISEKGTLYSVLSAETLDAVINKIISEGFKQ